MVGPNNPAWRHAMINQITQIGVEIDVCFKLHTLYSSKTSRIVPGFTRRDRPDNSKARRDARARPIQRGVVIVTLEGLLSKPDQHAVPGELLAHAHPGPHLVRVAGYAEAIQGGSLPAFLQGRAKVPP